MSRTPTWRLLVVVACMMGAFVAVTLKSYYLQVVVAAEHLERGDWRHLTERIVEAPRGTIVDADGRELAQSLHAPSLVFDPRFFFMHEADRAPELLHVLRDLEYFDQERFDAWSVANPTELPQYFLLERRMWPVRAEAYLDELRAAGIRSVYPIPEYRRVYPYRELAGHTVGMVSTDGRQGVSGVERVLDDMLRGGEVRWQVLRDSDRRSYLLEEPPDVRDAAGATVTLTLEAPLQRFVEDALSDTIEHFNAESGVVVVSRVATGEVVAMASWPPFNPNTLGESDDVAWSNPAVAHVFEPGSTAKIFTFAAAFDAGLLSLNEDIDCHGGRLSIGGYQISDTHRDHLVPAWQVMQHSSNIGAIEIGMRMSQQQHFDYLRAFGFGERSGGGFAGEAAGFIPRPRWAEVGHATISFGHGFNLTPLQLNMATAAIANDGVLMTPIIVREVRDVQGNVLLVNEPTPRRRVVSDEAADLTRRALETVVEQDGTGTRAAVEGFRVAGKTGTAELIDPETGRYVHEYLSSFTGFVPSDAPEFAITVMISRPDRSIGYYGGAVAAPLFREVAAEALTLEGVFPEGGTATTLATPAPRVAPAAEPTADMAPLVERSDVAQGRAWEAPLVPGVTPDLRGRWVMEAVSRASASGATLRVHGAGRIVRQEPAPLAPVPDSGVIEVWLEQGGGAGGDVTP